MERPSATTPTSCDPWESFFLACIEAADLARQRRTANQQSAPDSQESPPKQPPDAGKRRAGTTRQTSNR